MHCTDLGISSDLCLVQEFSSFHVVDQLSYVYVKPLSLFDQFLEAYSYYSHNCNGKVYDALIYRHLSPQYRLNIVLQKI